MTRKGIQVLIEAMLVVMDEIISWISRAKGSGSGDKENDVPKS
jgi:hypothetical protein